MEACLTAVVVTSYSTMVKSWSCLSVSCLVFVGAVAITSGCFMADCPRGGKRSELPANLNFLTRQCVSCGPGNIGNCVAENVCCGWKIGCFLGTTETAVCLRENTIDLPCQQTGKPCGIGNRGNCVARGICYMEAAYLLDENCNE